MGGVYKELLLGRCRRASVGWTCLTWLRITLAHSALTHCHYKVTVLLLHTAKKTSQNNCCYDKGYDTVFKALSGVAVTTENVSLDFFFSFRDWVGRACTT